MKARRVAFEVAERPSVEIPKLHPTDSENARWASERPRHAWIAFAKFGAIPGLAAFVGSIATRGSRYHRGWGWLALAGICGAVSVLSWLSMWKVVEEPKLRLKSLRAARLHAALADEPDDQDAELPRGVA